MRLKLRVPFTHAHLQQVWGCDGLALRGSIVLLRLSLTGWRPQERCAVSSCARGVSWDTWNKKRVRGRSALALGVVPVLVNQRVMPCECPAPGRFVLTAVGQQMKGSVLL